MLRIEDIHSGYGQLEILRGVSMEIKQGDIVALLGWNGAGKSTLLKTIIGLLQTTSGKIIFNGERIDGMDTAKILQKGIAYVPQASGVFPFLSIEENIRMGAYIEKNKTSVLARVREVFELFPTLEKRRNDRVSVLSGGERQMVSLARVLMLRPKLILLDEPSLGLDPINLTSILNKVTELNKTGLSFLVVEQKALKALEMANRAYVLEMGRTKYEGSPNDLKRIENVAKLYLGGEFK